MNPLLVVPALLGIAAVALAARPKASAPAQPEPQPLEICLDWTLRGERRLLVQTLNELQQALQSEVDRRQKPPAFASARKRLTQEEGLRLLSRLSSDLARTCRRAEAAFTRSGSPSGSPAEFCSAYARLFGSLHAASRTLWRAQFPPALDPLHGHFLALFASLYEQTARWPAKLSEAAQAVDSDTCSIRLTVVADQAPLQDALARVSSRRDSA